MYLSPPVRTTAHGPPRARRSIPAASMAHPTAAPQNLCVWILSVAAVRKEHPKIERKLSELVRRHGARRARYRGRWKVLCGQLMAATAANIKRIVRSLRAPTLALAEE